MSKLLNFIDEKIGEFNNLYFKTEKCINSSTDYDYILNLKQDVDIIERAVNKYKDDTELLELLAKDLGDNCFAMDKEHDKYIGDKNMER